MKKKITKNQVLGFGLAIATPFIIAACDDKPKGDNSCKCPNGTEHENLPCCDGTGCTCTEKLVQKEYPISLRDGKVIITVKYMALKDAPAPDYLSHLKSELEFVGNNLAYQGLMTNLANGGGAYTLEVESGESYNGFKNAVSGNKTIKVHVDWISDAAENETYIDQEIKAAFQSFLANVMMNNMIRMADRYDSANVAAIYLGLYLLL